MNYLQLAQRLRRKCRVIGSGPSAVTNQTEEYSRLLDWVNEAWMEIQRKHEKSWYFMRATCTAPMQQGLYAYGATEFGISDLGQFVLNYNNGDSFRVFNTAQGLPTEVRMQVMTYDEWRDTYLIGALRTAYQRPDAVAAGPDGKLYVGPIPDGNFSITGEYIRVPSELVLATATPSLPVQYHMAIVYRAMMLYGASESAPEVYTDGENNYDLLMREIERTQLPPIQLGGALA